MKRNLFLVTILVILLFSAVGIVAGEEGKYDYIFDNPNLTSQQKLDAFTKAAGWTPELETWLEDYHRRHMEQNIENLNSAPSGSQSGIGMGSASADPAQEQAIIDARMQAQYDAYQAEFAANYQATAAYTGAGSGTEADPYVITTKEQFLSINDDLSANYVLGANIDFGGKNNPVTTTIGLPKALLTGTLDGRGYVLENVYLNYDTSGLVQFINSNVDVKNLGMYVEAVGGLNGLIYADGNIQNCFAVVDFNVQSSEGVAQAGVLTPLVRTKTSDCWVSGDVITNIGGSYGGVSGRVHGNYASSIQLGLALKFNPALKINELH